MTDIPTGEYQAIVDRREGQQYALEVAHEEGPSELVVDEAELPEDGRHPDAVLAITIANGQLESATYDEELSEQRREDAQNRFNNLSRRLSSDSDEDSTDNGSKDSV